MGEEHGPILEAIRDLRTELKNDMRDGFSGLGKRMDKMEEELGGNIKEVATLTERVANLSKALEDEGAKSKELAEKVSGQVGDLYDKDREARGKMGLLEKRVYLITVAIIILAEGGKGPVLKLLGM